MAATVRSHRIELAQLKMPLVAQTLTQPQAPPWRHSPRRLWMCGHSRQARKVTPDEAVMLTSAMAARARVLRWQPLPTPAAIGWAAAYSALRVRRVTRQVHASWRNQASGLWRHGANAVCARVGRAAGAAGGAGVPRGAAAAPSGEAPPASPAAGQRALRSSRSTQPGMHARMVSGPWHARRWTGGAPCSRAASPCPRWCPRCSLC